MSRTIDYVERVSESFDALDAATQVDIAWELLMRLPEKDKLEFLRRLQFSAKLAGLTPPTKRRRNGAKPDDAPLLEDKS